MSGLNNGPLQKTRIVVVLCSSLHSRVPRDLPGGPITSPCLIFFPSQFLEHCTGALSLPFAARRLFDENGREHFILRDLERDALVYVSCGEPWSDPQLTKAEQQRRFLLANLAADISQIRQFVALRDPAGER